MSAHYARDRARPAPTPALESRSSKHILIRFTLTPVLGKLAKNSLGLVSENIVW